MDNDYQQLAIDIETDGFEPHADTVVAYANRFQQRLRLFEEQTALLVATINDADLPDLMRARAFGKLRFEETNRLTAQLLDLD